MQPDFPKKFQSHDIVGIGTSGASTRSWIAKDLPRWQKVIEAAKNQVN